MPLRARIAFLLVVATGLSANAQSPAWAPAVEAELLQQQRTDRIPGLSCAIVLRGELVFRLGLGLADVENDVPATPQTVYRLASISKPVTAVLAMQLAERSNSTSTPTCTRWCPSGRRSPGR